MDALIILGVLFLLANQQQTTTRHVGDIVVNSFSADQTEVCTSPRSSFKVTLRGGPAIIKQFRGDPTADFIAVYGRGKADE